MLMFSNMHLSWSHSSSDGGIVSLAQMNIKSVYVNFNFWLFLIMLVLKVHSMYLMCESHIVPLALALRLSKMDVLANSRAHHHTMIREAISNTQLSNLETIKVNHQS
jgi:hypothetical protein